MFMETFDTQTRRFPSATPSASRAFSLGRQNEKAHLELTWAASLSAAGLPFRTVCTAHSTREATAGSVPLSQQ